MPPKPQIKSSKTNAAQPETAPSRVGVSSYLTKPLGLLGWERLEPVLLAALATREPLLLIGKHGTAKSFLLERLAQVLHLNYRFYNASLVNYDDLVGIPVPNEAQTALRYISTPTAIWDAEVVFIDELNRTRPDLQNKLFSIIHERRVQGIPLEKLTYRWAAMNPPPTDNSEGDVYLGADALDPALSDRFGFLIEVPDWCDLSDADRGVILLDQFRGRHEFPVDVRELVRQTEDTYRFFSENPPDLCGYFIALESQLRGAGTRFSPRRLSTLYRTALGIQAARITLGRLAGVEEAPDLDTTLFLALSHGHPGLADRSLDRAALLAVHRHAWTIAGLDVNDPWRELLQIADPVERVLVGSRAGFPLSEADLSSLVLEAVAAQKGDEKRSAVALVIYLKFRAVKKIAATAVETLAGQLQNILRPKTTTHQVYGKTLERCRRVSSICSTLGNTPRDLYTRNLLNGFLPDGYASTEPEALQDFFTGLWNRFGLEGEEV